MSQGQRTIRPDRLVVEMLENLRAPHAPARRAAASMESLERLLGQVRGLVEENEGLADEVLRGYEQLNLIFDFTRQIASITDADEIVDVLLGRVARIFSAESVCLIEQGGGNRCLRDGLSETGNLADSTIRSFSEITARVRDDHSVAVAAVAEAQALAGPLSRLDNRVDVVLVLRSRAARPFDAGDTMILESVLAFAGQIIGNSELHERLRRMSMETTRALVAAIDKKDHYTCGHSERVGLLSRMVGRELGLTPPELQTLEWSGLLHDVGKIGVPEAILQKPGKLTDEEFGEIKKHPTMGFEILKPVASLGPVLDGVLYHHENPDGSGYPTGLRGDDTPLFARIIHVVDVFDALTSARAYRAAFTIDQAIEILRKDAGTKLDPAVVAAMLRVIERLRTHEPQQLAAMYAPESAGGVAPLPASGGGAA